ncbi:MAG: hypothetical protein HC865_17340, partial [Cyanobacteria bacterium RU_5_0]|nr:hypothetical protein [Cyanobacteria bacterium RU_5_0]
MGAEFHDRLNSLHEECQTPQPSDSKILLGTVLAVQANYYWVQLETVADLEVQQSESTPRSPHT